MTSELNIIPDNTKIILIFIEILKIFLFSNNLIECGRSEVRPNTRIVGGIKSVPHSWPSQVLIVQSYKGYYDLRPLAPSNKTFISVEFRCGGTLIDLNTVVSAAHCVIKEFDYYIFGYVYSLKIKLNEFYPTMESMFSIYLGVHETSFLKTNEQLPPTVSKLGTSKIIIVISSDLLIKFLSYLFLLQI